MCTHKGPQRPVSHSNPDRKRAVCCECRDCEFQILCFNRPFFHLYLYPLGGLSKRDTNYRLPISSCPSSTARSSPIFPHLAISI